MTKADIDFFIDKYEKEFRTLNELRWFFIFLVVAVTVLCFYFFVWLTSNHHIKAEFELYLFCIFVFIIAWKFLGVILSRKYKKDILRNISSFYNFPLDYQIDKGLDASVFERAGIVPGKVKDLKYRREDMFFGNTKGVTYALSEFAFTKEEGSGKHKKTTTLLEGTAMLFELPVRIPEPVKIGTRRTRLWENDVILSERESFFSADFWNLFSVTKSKDIHRYLFTPDLQRLFVECANNLRELCDEHDVTFIFKDNFLLMYVGTTRNRFEMKLLSKGAQAMARADLLFLFSCFLLAKNVDVILKACEQVRDIKVLDALASRSVSAGQPILEEEEEADEEDVDEPIEDELIEDEPIEEGLIEDEAVQIGDMEEQAEEPLFSPADDSAAIHFMMNVGGLVCAGIVLFFCYRTFWQGICHYLDFLVYLLAILISVALMVRCFLLPQEVRPMRLNVLLGFTLILSAVLMWVHPISRIGDPRLSVLRNGAWGVFEKADNPNEVTVVLYNRWAAGQTPRLFIGDVPKGGRFYRELERMASTNNFNKISWRNLRGDLYGYGQIDYDGNGYHSQHIVYIGNVERGIPMGYGLMFLERGTQVEGMWQRFSYCDDCTYRAEQYTVYGDYDFYSRNDRPCMVVNSNGAQFLGFWDCHRFKGLPDGVNMSEDWWKEYKAKIDRNIQKNRPRLNQFRKERKQIYEKYKKFLN